MSIQFKRGTADKRKTNTSVLDKGQPFFETDTNKLYMGDGATALKSLKPIVESSNNEFTGTNTFKNSLSLVSDDDTLSETTINAAGAHFSYDGNIGMIDISNGGDSYDPYVEVGSDFHHITTKLTGSALQMQTAWKKGYKIQANADESKLHVIQYDESDTATSTDVAIPTNKAGTLALTEDCFTIITKSYSSNGSYSFTAAEMTQIVNHFDKTIICIAVASAYTFNHYLYPSSSGTTHIFASSGIPFGQGPIGDSSLKLTITGSAGSTGTGTLSFISPHTSSTTIISKTITAWPTATAPVSISFTTDENSKISNKDTFKNVIIQVEVNEKNYVCLYPVGYGNIIYIFASSDNVYKLIITSGVGQMTYTKPAEIAGDNTFTGSNVFKKAVTLYTDAVNGNSMSATLDSYKLKLFNDLGGVYADLNITSDTAPYLELKTAGHGKVKYTPESIIFTDTYGSSNTTTLKFPGQGATADSIQTLATLEGNQIFTRAITTTDINGFIIAPGATANNHTASIWIDSATLADEGKNIDLEISESGIIATKEWTTKQLQGLFTYANNTLTINI